MEIRKQKVVVEFSGGDWIVLFDNSQVRFFETPDKALKAIRQASGRGNKDATITTIEWRNTPAGFVTPK